MPIYYGGENKFSNRGHRHDLRSRQQLHRCSAPHHHPDPRDQQPIVAHVVLHTASRAGCEAPRVPGAAAQCVSGTFVRKVHADDQLRFFSGAGLGLLRMDCMADICGAGQERLPRDPR